MFVGNAMVRVPLGRGKGLVIIIIFVYYSDMYVHHLHDNKCVYTRPKPGPY